jgi:protocatechuate 3,4-dioxygenase beta subunit
MHAGLRLVFTVMVAAAAATVAAAQTTPRRAAPATVPQQQSAAAPATAHLTGHVSDARDGTALRRALIAVAVGGRISSKVISDEDGRFEIDAPGTFPYVVTVTKPGFLASSLLQPPARSGRAMLEISLARSATVSGRVIDPSGNPVVSVRVRVQQADNSVDFGAWTTTDDLGAYRLSGLLPGRYRLETMGRPEYSSSFDALRQLDATSRARSLQLNPLPPPTSDPITVDVQAGGIADVTIVHREPAVILSYANVGGVISGQISDEFGEPAPGLSVQPYRLDVDNGVVTATKYNAPRVTDDRGQYRAFHLKAGRYALIVTDDATQAQNRESPWLPVYYPGTSSPAEAMVLTVGRAQELGGTDMVFTHSTGALVFGTAMNAAGHPLQTALSLLPSNPDPPVPPSPRRISVDPDGTFVFESVSPGDYVVRATPDRGGSTSVIVGTQILVTPISPRDTEFAMLPVHVSDTDVGPLTIRTATPATLRGHINFEGIPPITTNFQIVAFTTDPRFNVTGRPSDGTISTATIDHRTGSFEIPGLSGPIRLRLTAAPLGTWLKSAYVGAVNAAESPAILMTSKDSRDDVTIVIAGTAGSVTGSTQLGAQVLVFPTDREHWYIGSPYVQSIYSDESGRFIMTSLPPGEYFIVAIDSDENELSRREGERIDLFESLITSARRITLGESQAVTVSPRVVTMNKK